MSTLLEVNITLYFEIYPYFVIGADNVTFLKHGTTDKVTVGFTIVTAVYVFFSVGSAFYKMALNKKSTPRRP